MEFVGLLMDRSWLSIFLPGKELILRAFGSAETRALFVFKRYYIERVC